MLPSQIFHKYCNFVSHAVGAGCIYAMAHDYRLMISDHPGYIFMNEFFFFILYFHLSL
ncbi:hypothetical protein CsSME_00019018 [Camellia sinensis var. sinensis]